MDRVDYDWLASELVRWFSLPENYSVVHFAIEKNMSKEELFRLAGESSVLQKALDYGLSVQEYKLSHGALTGMLDVRVAQKFLETYNGWKSDVSFIERNEYKQFMNEASEKAAKILKEIKEIDAEGGHAAETDSRPEDEQLSKEDS